MSNAPMPPTLNFMSGLKSPLRWAALSGLLTAVLTILMPNHYRSEARLLPVESKGAAGNLGGLASAAAAFGVSVPGGDGNDANFVDVLNSRWLREQVLSSEYQYHFRRWRFGVGKIEKKTLYDYLEAENMDRAIQALAPILSVSRDLKTKVISIAAETTSPELSQLIVQKASKLLETFNREKGRTRGGAKVAFAEARLMEGRKEMDEAEGAFRLFLEANRNYQTSGDPAVRLNGARLETELRLRQQLVTSIAMNREQAMLEEKNDIPILNVLDSGNLPIEKSKPARSIIVLAVAMIVGLATWAWQKREWFWEWLRADDAPVAANLG